MKNTLKKELNRLMPNTGIETIHGEFNMRFELGGEGNNDKLKRIEQATKRGVEIYNQLIGEGEIIITIQEWENDFHNANNENKSYLSRILNGSELNIIEGPFEQLYYEENAKGEKEEKVFEEPLECTLMIGRTKLSLEQVALIIKGIASLEMGKEPCISQNVFFFSIEKQSGFRIYDDRGCDVWANSLENLRPIYEKLNSWILDYNRPEIDKMFKKNMV